MGAFEAIEAMGTLDEGLRAWTGAAQTAHDTAMLATALPMVAPVGDWLPTFVTPDDAKRYIGETNAGYERLALAIDSSPVSARFKEAWATQLKGWQAFRDEALRNVGWLNTKATMEQNDRWTAQLGDWDASYRKEPGAKPVGPAPTPPQVSPGPVGDKVQTAFLIVAAIAGIAATGYLIHSMRAKTV